MFEEDPFSTRVLSRFDRCGLTASGLVLAGLLVVAGVLPPDSRGFGTHQQLGFPPCSIQTWFHVRCPSCGMTTAWSHFVRGQWLSAFRANVGGALLAASAVLAVPWCLGSAWRGQWLRIRPADWGVVVFGLGTVTITAADWLVRVFWAQPS